MDLNEKNLEIIFEKGFDNWESLLLLNEQELTEIGVEDKVERLQILACIREVQDMINIENKENNIP